MIKFNIFRQKNFLDKEIYDYFLNFFLYSSFFENKKSRALYTEEHYVNNGDLQFKKNINIYNLKVLKILLENYGLDLYSVSGTALRKWYPEEYQDTHSDCELSLTINNDKVESKPFNNFSSMFIDYAALLYLNDEYEGGEIFFPEHGVTIKPEPNEFISFPGTTYYKHGVNRISKGSRFVMQGFYGSLKFLYLWQNFVIPDIELKSIDRNKEFYANNKVPYNRSNIPSNHDFNTTTHRSTTFDIIS
jgi:hypothetical protein